MSDEIHDVGGDDDLLQRFERLGPRVQRHFTRACATVRIIEMGYEIYGHRPEAPPLVEYIRRRVYADALADPDFDRHILDCRECRRLMRRHAIRKAIYVRLGLDVPHWSQ
jgi:hypothetical protein